MTNPKPIRFDLDTWLVMRTDPVIPKAVVQRHRDRKGADRYLLIRWDLDPAKRQLMSMHASLEEADKKVLYDNNPSEGYWSGPPNGIRAGNPNGRKSG